MLFEGIILDGLPTSGILYKLPRIYIGKFIIPNRNNYKFIYKKTELFIRCLKYDTMLNSFTHEGDIYNYAHDVNLAQGIFPYHHAAMQGAFYLRSKDGKTYIGSMKDSRRFGYGLMILQNGHSMIGHWSDTTFQGIYRCPTHSQDKESVKDRMSSQAQGIGESHELVKKTTISKYQESVSHYESVKRITAFNKVPVEVKGFFKISGEKMILTAFGDINFQDGSMYRGEISNNKMSGFGTMHYSTGEIYQGQWKHNQPNGIGKLTGEGFKFEGQFSNGGWQGFGTLKLDGKMIKGEWDKGKLKYALMDDINSKSNLMPIEKMTISVQEEMDIFKMTKLELTGTTQVIFRGRSSFSPPMDKLKLSPSNQDKFSLNPFNSIVATNTYGQYSEIEPSKKTLDNLRQSEAYLSYQARPSIQSRMSLQGKQMQFIGVFTRNEYSDLEGFTQSQIVGIGYIVKGHEVIFKGLCATDFSKFFGIKYDHDTETEMKGYFNFNLKLTGLGEMTRGNTRYAGNFRKNYKAGLVKKWQDGIAVMVAEYEDDKKNGYVLKLQTDGQRILTEYSYNRLKRIYYNR